VSEDIKAKLLRRHTGEEPHKIDGVGEIMLRGMSMGEVLIAASMERGDERDAYTISCGMAEPVMTPEEVADWFNAADSKEITDVRSKIQRLSRLDTGAAKEVYEEFEADPAAEFPALPSAQAGDDGNPDDGGDVVS